MYVDMCIFVIGQYGRIKRPFLLLNIESWLMKKIKTQTKTNKQANK